MSDGRRPTSTRATGTCYSVVHDRYASVLHVRRVQSTPSARFAIRWGPFHAQRPDCSRRWVLASANSLVGVARSIALELGRLDSQIVAMADYAQS